MTAETLGTLRTDLGKILVDGHGRTLYMFTADIPGEDSACGPTCVQEWPALDAPAAHTGIHVTRSLVATIERPDGTEQITYRKHPLYYFGGDEAVGQTEGHGVTAFGGTWHALRPDGTPVAP